MSLIITKNFKRVKAQDAVERNAASDELNVGDKIWITQYGRNYPYTITKKWKEGWTVWYKAKNDKSGKEEIVAGAFANALDAAEAGDAEQFKVGDLVRMSEGGLTGKITKIEPNGHFRVSFLYNKANGFSQSFSANEIVMVKPAKDAAELNNDADLRAALPKMADIAKRLTDAKDAGNRDAYESSINQARMECEKAIRNEPDADDYSDVTALVKQAKALLDKAFRAI